MSFSLILITYGSSDGDDPFGSDDYDSDPDEAYYDSDGYGSDRRY